jgi:hypothetical protein
VHQTAGEARAHRSTALDPELPDNLPSATTKPPPSGSSITGCGTAIKGTIPATRGCRLRDCKEQVFLFTRDFAADGTNNVPEPGAKAAERHQAVSGDWHTLHTLARGYHHYQPRLDTKSRHPVNGRL